MARSLLNCAQFLFINSRASEVFFGIFVSRSLALELFLDGGGLTRVGGFSAFPLWLVGNKLKGTIDGCACASANASNEAKKELTTPKQPHLCLRPIKMDMKVRLI